MGGAQIVLVGAELAVDQADLHEAAPRGLAHLRRPDRCDDRQHVDARSACRRGLVERVDEEHGDLALAFQRQHVGDGPSIAVHDCPVGIRSADRRSLDIAHPALQ